MTQILLRSNRRFGALWMGGGFVCGLLTLWSVLFVDLVVVRVVAVLFLLSAISVTFWGWKFCFVQPRLAMNDDELLVYIQRSQKPFRVPIDVVEVFFIGQGAVTGEEPGQPNDYHGAVAANVIVRIAESAKQWQERDVDLWLGVWREGYITLRGLWCEDINQEVLKRMNRQLMDAKRRRRSRQDN
jgi:hypothetical protein